MSKQSFWINGETITFDPINHVYSSSKKKYVSVTNLVSGLFPRFELERISREYAAKHGLKQADVKKMWRDKGQRAARRGNRCHSYAKRKFKNEPLPTPENEDEEKLYEQVNNCINKLLIQYTFLGAEKMIASPTHGIAGTTDLVLMEKTVKKLVILEWKAVETIEQYSQWDNGLFYLSHLTHCNYNHFSLQLNLYKTILEVENYYECEDYGMGILHVMDDNYYAYKVPHMKKEINNILTVGIPK